MIELIVVINILGILLLFFSCVPEFKLDIQDVFTVHGLEPVILENGRYKYSAKVNINTAPVYVIQVLLPLGMKDFAQELVDFRVKKSEDGNIFKVECTGTVNSSKVKLAAWVKKEKQKESEKRICKIIQIERE